jgi:glucose 1-dehydrogenase
MKAIAVNPRLKQIGLVDREEPRISTTTDVLIRVREVGVCGTDKEISRFEYGTPPDGSDYLVIGHESLGEVVDAGPDVTRVKKGDLVVVMVRRPCLHAECGPCHHSRQDFCTTGDYSERGIKQRDGFMTGYIVDDEQYLCPVPAELADIGVLTEPLTIAEKGLQEVKDVQSRMPWVDPKSQNAVVVGAGPVGLLGAMGLRVRGYKTFVYSREDHSDERARLTEAMGAVYVSSADTTPEQLANKVGNIDLVYEATGVSSVSFEILKYLGINASYVFTGIPALADPKPVEIDRIMRQMVLRNQLILGTVNANRPAFENAIADLGEFRRQFPDAIGKLISKRWQMEEHADLLTGRSGGIKNVISLEHAL